MTTPPKLTPPAKGFLHVIDAHRWLAASGCLWNRIQEKEEKNEGHIDVMARDCALVHARALIDFYTSSRANRHVTETDILLVDFYLSISTALKSHLNRFKRPIEVHLLHITAWRDSDYRKKHAKNGHKNTMRPDWNSKVSRIVRLIHRALKSASASASHKSPDWGGPFRDLYKASARRYHDKLFEWPEHLTEKDKVEQHLRGLGLL